MVSTRYCAGSYLNKVELQNDCLAFGIQISIVSTIHGSNLDTNGKLDYDMLKNNLYLAVDIYINTVSSSPCSGIKFQLVKTVESMWSNARNSWHF